MEDRSKAIFIHSLLYSLCYDISDKTKVVNTWMRQIRLGLKKLPYEEYKDVITNTHVAWQESRKSVIESGDKLNVKMSELLATLYNRVPDKYQNMYYTDKTFTKVINSFDGCRGAGNDELLYTTNARTLADSFLKEIKIEAKNTLLSRRKKILEQNLILEGKL